MEIYSQHLDNKLTKIWAHLQLHITIYMKNFKIFNVQETASWWQNVLVALMRHLVIIHSLFLSGFSWEQGIIWADHLPVECKLFKNTLNDSILDVNILLNDLSQMITYEWKMMSVIIA